jgi:mannosyl-3-phosphoglycerate phosphatase
MTDLQVAEAARLTHEQARRAKQREYDEPFEILDPARAGALLEAIEREGMNSTEGGRFHHIVGGSDKVNAVGLLTDLYERALGPIITIGFGDSPNDAGFLTAVDVPVLVDSPRVERLRALVPRGRVTRSPGPRGWNEAALALLAGEV